MDVIRAAARDVERPIFYAIAVIIAAYLPIYVLTGPVGAAVPADGRHHVVRALGALICSLTLLPVLCAYFLRKNVREPEVPLYERVRRRYGRALDVCACGPAGTAVVCVAAVRRVAGDRPVIGAEFMPHLDEGALWIRATMPYTISFDEASKLGPAGAQLLLAFPGDHGRQRAGPPRRRHRPDWLLQRRVLRRPQAYDDPAWRGRSAPSPQLIAAIQAKLAAFPGIIFNYTQPAEDAVDEAETGLKSSLAVKIFGPDLATLESQGRSGPAHDHRRCRASATSRSSASWASPASPSSRTARRSRATG